MENYFNLTIEERKALADKRSFRPANFSKAQPTVVEETESPVEETPIEETPVKKSKKSKK